MQGRRGVPARGRHTPEGKSTVAAVAVTTVAVAVAMAVARMTVAMAMTVTGMTVTVGVMPMTMAMGVVAGMTVTVAMTVTGMTVTGMTVTGMTVAGMTVALGMTVAMAALLRRGCPDLARAQSKTKTDQQHHSEKNRRFPLHLVTSLRDFVEDDLSIVSTNATPVTPKPSILFWL